MPPERRTFVRALCAGSIVGLAGCPEAADTGDGTRTDTDGVDSPTEQRAIATETETATLRETDTATAAGTETTGTEATGTEARAGLADAADPLPEAVEITVAKDGSGDVETVEAAVAAAPTSSRTETRVRIEPGRYHEQVTVPESKRNLTFVGTGEGPAETVLTYDSGKGTSTSASVTVEAEGFTARNLTFENAYGRGTQAVALLATGSRATFLNCRFLGRQDTLFADGPGATQYYRDCYVEGTTDFVFGGANALFADSEIRCLADASYVTAASTPESAAFGLTFVDCEVTTTDPDQWVYLGRPWKPHATTSFVHCHLGEHVVPEGWHNWGDPAKEETAYYAEYDNEGPGWKPDQRVDWVHVLDDDAGAAYTRENVLGGWNPALSFVDTGQLVLDRGEVATLAVRRRNVESTATAGGEISLDAPDGWEHRPLAGPTVEALDPGEATTVEALDPGGTATVGWALRAPESARGEFAVTATGPDGRTATRSVLVVDETGETAPIPYGLNNGGEAAVGVDGVRHLPVADPGDRKYVTATGGEFGSYTGDAGDIEGTDHDLLYRSETSGSDTSFAVAVGNGTYDVTLHFAEIYHEEPGQRVFDVSVEGETVFERLDIVEAVGPDTALVETVEDVAVTDGALDVETTTHVDNSKISGVTIERA